MRVGIIGAGFTGLTAGLKLAKAGHDVTVFEASDIPGGLAAGFKSKKWSWSLEKHYHHLFTSDKRVIGLANEVGVEVNFFKPKTSMLFKNKIYQLDSPASLLKFSQLSLIDRLRAGVVLAYLKLTPFWQTLENITAEKFLKKTMGNNVWKVMWQPLFEGKFGEYANKVSASWFWARIKKRSTSLGYPAGGFAEFASRIEALIHKNKGKIVYNKSVVSIEKKKEIFIIKFSDKTKAKFDKVICTMPTKTFVSIVKSLPDLYIKQLKSLKGLGAVTLVVSLKKKYFGDGTYWLNINDRKKPFLALVEHTNLVDSKHYEKENLLYISNYLRTDHRYFGFSAEELFKEFEKPLRNINKAFDISWVSSLYIFKSDFAQPIAPLNFSKYVPSMQTPIKGLYLANMQQVYPWDRGTNYAVQLGEDVAERVIGG